MLLCFAFSIGAGQSLCSVLPQATGEAPSSWRAERPEEAVDGRGGARSQSTFQPFYVWWQPGRNSQHAEGSFSEQNSSVDLDDAFRRGLEAWRTKDRRNLSVGGSERCWETGLLFCVPGCLPSPTNVYFPYPLPSHKELLCIICLFFLPRCLSMPIPYS